MQIAEAACDVDMCCMVVCMQKLHVFLTCVAWQCVAEAACVVGMCCMVVGMQKLHVILTCVVGMCYMYNTYMILENTCCCNGPRKSL